jgi:hypothetical protein
METIEKQGTLTVVGALLVFIAAMSPNAVAGRTRYKADDNSALVIMHLAISGTPVTAILLEEKDDRRYLYIEQSAEAFTIVDVTRPDHAKIVKRFAWPGNTSRGRLEMVGADLALVRASGEISGVPGSGQTSESISVLDLTDPQNPRTLQSFNGVTSATSDQSRNLIYITNGDGLWVLRPKQKESAPSTQWCTSESAISGDLANCY